MQNTEKVHPVTIWLPRLGKQHPQCIINSVELLIAIPHKCKDMSAKLAALKFTQPGIMH